MNWAVLGILISVAIGLAGVVFAGLGYRLGRNDAKKRGNVVYKFPLAEIFQGWVFTNETPLRCGFKLRLSFQNTHDIPLGYEVETLKLRTRENEAWQDTAFEIGDSLDGTRTGIVAPTQREIFTLPPVGPVLIDLAPVHAHIEYVVKYGPVSGQKAVVYQWRETRQLAVTMAFPVMMRDAVSAPFSWAGTPTIERIGRRSWAGRLLGSG